MKSDSSRITFDPRKHFSSVRMQQGRVQIDADGNEQSDIFTHRVETEAGDVIGLCGGPIHNPAFHIVAALAELSPEEQALPGNKALPAGFKVPDFLISAGRYYVDGILCENEWLTSYLNQTDLPRLKTDVQPVVSTPGLYLVYVDVWQRLLTALDDPSIREIALGGPDTATRVKNVWQIKLWAAVDAAGKKIDGNCATKFEVFDKLIAPGDGALSARTKPAAINTDPCIVPPGAGYTGLENQLYRIEIHDGGSALDAGTKGSPAIRVPKKDATEGDRFKVGGTWKVGQAVEIFSPKAPDDPLNGTLGYVTEIKGTGKAQTLTFDTDGSKITADELNIREAKATFKWSRDNGVVVTTIQEINVKDKRELTVHDLGPDDTLGFKVGNWVEISDDALELNGLPGQLAQITKVDSAVNLITLNVPATLTLNPARHPKLRRWDGIGAVKFASGDAFLDLENGVQVRFFAGAFKTADYWTVAARTATADTQSGNIEWPRDAGNIPLAQLPFGIKHHYCRLAMAHWDGAKFDAIEDCRKLFPPLTELTSLLYVNGAGQESMPGLPQPQALQAGVFNGRWPVSGARVRFTPSHKGRLTADITGLPSAMPPSTPSAPVTVSTGADGLASCAWMLDTGVESQWVEARLLDAGGNPLPAIVKFDGNLSLAKQVFYDPAKCPDLKKDNVTTVQDAIDHLCEVQHGGCCDVTVGKGGQFERLDEAIKNLLGKKETDICICLLAGDHQLPEGLLIVDVNGKEPRTHVKITGCGLATRLQVGDSQLSDTSFIKVGPLASFTLRDVAVATRDNTRLLQFRGCEEVLIENCHLSAHTGELLGPPSVLTIERARVIRITGNEVSALFEKPEGLDLIKVRRPEFFQTRSLTSLADDIAKALAGATPPLRQQFVKPYQDYLKNNQRVSTAQREIMNGSIKSILEFNQSTGEVLTGNPVAIRSLVHGTALGLLDAQADTLIENNRFIGRVSLYGDEEWFGNAEWNSFLGDLRAGKFQLTSPAAALQMRSNSLSGIRVDRRILKAMQAANGQLRNLFGRALLTDNWCFNETYQLLANQLTIGSNQFNYGQDFRSNVNVGALLLITPVAAVVGGRSVVIVGNSAPNPSSRLLYAVPPSTVTSINSAQLAANFLDVKPL